MTTTEQSASTRDLASAPAGTLVEAEVFVDVDLSRLTKLELYRCRFEGCRFPEASLSGVVFEACTFIDCDLTRARLGDSSFRGVVFRDCKLLGVDFGRAAANPEVTFERCLLRYAVFDGVNLRGTTFSDCQIQEATFVEADLQDASFAGCDLSLSTFRRAALGGVDFSDAVGVFFEPRENQSKDAYIAVETAVQLARQAGLRVAGYDKPRAAKGRATRRGR